MIMHAIYHPQSEPFRTSSSAITDPSGSPPPPANGRRKSVKKQHSLNISFQPSLRSSPSPRLRSLLPELGKSSSQDEPSTEDQVDSPPIYGALGSEESAALAAELDRVKREKLKAFYDIERYKKVITYAIIFCFFSLLLAIVMVVWRFTEDKPTFDELRKMVLSTPGEDPRLCYTVYPDSIDKKFDPDEVGEPLYLTPLIKEGKLEEAASLSKVTHIMQSERSHSGFLTVDPAHNSSLFFWFFPSFNDHDDKPAERSITPDGEKPLILWLQGGPGWPSMYGLFKENGPFLVGYDHVGRKASLIPNKFSWSRDSHMLYIDNPVGTGFSRTEHENGYPRSDEEASEMLLEALKQFIVLFPMLTKGQEAEKTEFYAFGESYGGAYAVSLARTFLRQKEKEPSSLSNIDLKGIGLGNSFISAVDQSVYADVFSYLGYITDDEMERLRQLDNQTLTEQTDGNFAGSISHSQASLHTFASDVMNLTNIYDFTFNDNYLTNHEYVCFLQQDHVREGIHAGGLNFNRGHLSYAALNASINVSKKSWLEEVLNGGIETLIYNGNLDVIVHVPGMNKVVKSLRWAGQPAFSSARRNLFWVWNEEEARGELAGYFHEGGGLTYMIVRNAGHMVPISQPRWARQIAFEFTRKKAGSRGGDRFAKPEEIKPLEFSSLSGCA